MQSDLDPLAKQRAQLERDLENVRWIADAAAEMLDQLESSKRLLSGQAPVSTANVATQTTESPTEFDAVAPPRIAALVPIDPDRNGWGIKRSLAEKFREKNVLQATLEQLGQSKQIETIILIAPTKYDVDSLVDRSQIPVPIEVEHCDASPFGPDWFARRDT